MDGRPGRQGGRKPCTPLIGASEACAGTAPVRRAQSFLFFGDRVAKAIRVAEDLGGCSTETSGAMVEWIASAAEITITEP